MEKLGLLLIDDHPLFRDSFVMAMRQLWPGADVVPVPTMVQAHQVIKAHPSRFDLVLVDYKLPGCDGLLAAVDLGMQFPGVSVGLISGEDASDLPERARAAGLVAYLSKSLEMDELLAALGELAQGRAVFADKRVAPAVTSPDPSFGLTPRQMEVLRRLSTGASNKVIAQEMGISPATVKNHLDVIFEKMGVTNRLQAVMLARAAVGVSSPPGGDGA